MSKLSFTEHPRNVGESYVEHLGVSWSFARSMFRAGFCALIHGLFPFLFVTTGSSIVKRLNDRMVVNRIRQQSKTTT